MDRRKFLILGGSALAAGAASAAESPPRSEEKTGILRLSYLEAGPEGAERAVKTTITSLYEGIRSIFGHPENPRKSGFGYHAQLIDHYARGMGLPETLAKEEKVSKIKEALRERIRIFPISKEDLARLERKNTQHDLQSLADAIAEGEVGACVYLSEDRRFQRLYVVTKNPDNTLLFLESHPVSTSREEPGTRYDASVTPLGLFSIPHQGVRLGLPGEVTKMERPDLTKYYFSPIIIDGVTKYFVKNFNRTADDEIVTVTGDTHLLWSPEINGKGIKIHDTTEVQDIGMPASSGCIRTPSVRRFTQLTLNNKFPTKVLIHWADDDKNPRNMRGFGGTFGGQPLPRQGKK